MTRKSKSNKSRQETGFDEHQLELTETDKLLLETLAKQVTRSQNGRTETFSLGEGVIQKQIQTALAGSPHALNQVLKSARAAQELQYQIQQAAIRQGRQLKENLQKRLANLERNLRKEGLSETQITMQKNDMFPHPDDVVITDSGYELKGPVDEDGLSRLHGTMAERDAWLLQAVLDERVPITNAECEQSLATLEEHDLGGGLPIAQCVGEERMSLMMAFFFNDTLPKRFRLTEFELGGEMSKHRRHTKRELEKLCYRTWKRLGKKKATRGWVSPPIGTGVEVISNISKMATRCHDIQKKDGDVTMREIIDIVCEAFGMDPPKLRADTK